MNDSVLNVITYAAIWTLKINRKVSQVTPRRTFNILADEVDNEREDKNRRDYCEIEKLQKKRQVKKIKDGDF